MYFIIFVICKFYLLKISWCYGCVLPSATCKTSQEKKKIGKLNNFSKTFEKDFYKSWSERINSDFGSNFQWKIVTDAPNEDVKNIFCPLWSLDKKFSRI